MSFYNGIQEAKGLVERHPPLIDGFYPKLLVLRVYEHHGAREKGGKIFWKALVAVLESGPGLSQPGTVTSVMQQLNGSHPQISLAEISKFTGACMGIQPADEARRAQAVTPQAAQGTTLPSNPLAGSIIAGHTALGKDRGPGKDRIPNWHWQPVLDPGTGKPMFMQVPESLRALAMSADQPQTPTTSAPTAGPAGYTPAPGGFGGAYTPPAAFGAQAAPGPFGAQAAPGPFGAQAAPAPAPAPAPVFPPAGWTELQGHPGQFYKPGMTTCITADQLRQLVAAGQA